MHTMLINDYNIITTTKAERIVQKSKDAHTICIRVKDDYHGAKMSECSALLFYRLPVSEEWHPFELTPSEELYKGTHVEYQFLADTWLTKEFGDVQIEIRFYKASMDGNVNINQYVRKATDGIIHISRSQDWASGIADPLLDTLDQRIIQLMMVQNRQDEMIAESYINSAAGIEKDEETKEIYLVNTIGSKLGTSVIDETCDPNGVPVVEFGQHADDTTREEIDNVVEFGYEDDDFNNVVEF